MFIGHACRWMMNTDLISLAGEQNICRMLLRCSLVTVAYCATNDCSFKNSVETHEKQHKLAAGVGTSTLPSKMMSSPRKTRENIS